MAHITHSAQMLSPAARSGRWLLASLCALVAIDAVCLVFESPLRRYLQTRGSAAIQLRAADLIAQPRLHGPEVRAPWQEMLESARTAVAARRGDIALKILAEVDAQVPRQPFAMAELATQYEKLGESEKALVLWRKIHEFGQQAGVYFATAEAKLAQLEKRKDNLNETNRIPATSEYQSASATGSKPTAMLRFGKFSIQESPNSANSKKHLALSMPVIKANGAKVEAKDVSIEVQFYDQTQGKNIERTNANIEWKWVSNATDWSDNSAKTLQVEYRQGSNRRAGEQRAYYGYVASVYYQEKLQDVRADPPRLGQQYPPPRILPKENNP
jgi:hypothetical protein